MDDLALKQIQILREASNVKRCHVFTYHGEYTVGKHTYDMLSLLFILHKKPSLNLIRAVHMHDVAERWFGDIPANLKMSSPMIDMAIGQMEKDQLEAAGFRTEALTTVEEQWLKALDKLELWLWCKDQYVLGNLTVQIIARRVEQWVKEHRQHIPTPILYVFTNYRWTRTEEV